MLATENGIFLAHRLLDVGVADARADRSTALGGDRLRNTTGRDEVIDDRSTCIALEQPRRDHRGQDIAADDVAFLVNEKNSIGVTVEGCAEVIATLNDDLTQLGGVFRFDGVGGMVWKGAVWLKIHGEDLHR